MFSQVSEQRFLASMLRTPATITPEVIELAAGINADETPVFVQYRPGSEALLQECYANVDHRVAVAGGRPVVGWAIWEWNEVFVEAEHHAVWQGPEELIDITPHGIPIERVLFLPDPTAPYLGPVAPRRPNRRVILSRTSAAMRFLAAIDARNLRMERFAAGEVVRLTNGQADQMQQLEAEAMDAQADLLISQANSKGRNDRCLCGSGRKFKSCCMPEFA